MKLRLAFHLAVPLLLTVAHAAAARPNILPILPDQMRVNGMVANDLRLLKSQPKDKLLQIFVPFNPDGIAKPWRGIVTARHTYRAWTKANPDKAK